MFAVVGAKLSEGINFSDNLTRAVVMVGMSFANAARPGAGGADEVCEGTCEDVWRIGEVRVQTRCGESMSSFSAQQHSTVSRKGKALTSSLILHSVEKVNELYLNMCMKAVNQSIGRAIRHKNDYATLILLDRRYAHPDIRNRLPGWIRNEVKTVKQFGPAMAGLGAFFRGKK
ncbi:unnamed protein product [Tilletia laevis]|uniref:ATP-dependent helicase C-terminal domain-containing protein n=3 Tax=Tilletia caries TaxID=13290 RepID=A0ABN7JBY2_9BASI|nr:hypothetical protein CF328_g7777 [Tilletia controversa]CAD6901287.1 unnamed protein product [Tilletia caries]CAD6934974.1 unnamed protein product [Tilletia laevis]CAD6959706.1 unnamed protein product [Tilletia caries]CAD7062794.1 unnamed protein product [Tilletia caries]